MNADDLAERMRRGEVFHSFRAMPGAWVVLRVDGRGFSRLTETQFEKPFDPRFHDAMVRAASALIEDFGGVYAYTQSDEISVLFPPEWTHFDREVEKLVSVAAGIASATFTHAAGTPAAFDGRIWLGTDERAVLDYFRWRQSDATRCALNGWCYWTLRKEGRSVREATASLERTTVSAKNELLFQRGINFNELPPWQRRGSGITWESYLKEGMDPRDGRRVETVRRRLRVEASLPMKDEYESWLRARIADAATTSSP